jgi:hypothetical protein
MGGFPVREARLEVGRANISTVARPFPLARCAVLAVLCGWACAEAPPRPAPSAPPRVAGAPSAAAAAPGDQETVALRSLCGYLLVTNAGAAHFSVELAGTDVRVQQSGGNQLFIIDDLAVQLITVDHQEMPTGIGKHGADLLRAHEAWESAHFNQLLGAKVEPADLEIINKSGGPWKTGLNWWFDLPKGVATTPGISGSVFLTFELADHVVGLSAQSLRGLQRLDVMARLATWWSTARVSRSELSPADISADIRARAERGEACALPPEPPSATGVDRRLRFDGLPARDTDRLRDVAEQAGGVERLVVGGRRRYRNHVCRFEFEYPDDGWKDFEVHDLSDKGCTANISTPPIRDSDTGEEFPNAVAIWATKASADFGREQMQAAIVGAVKQKAARFAAVKKPLLQGALDATYVVDLNGTHFVGEVLTVRRGDMLYNVHFNSTQGTIGVGRPAFMTWMASLKLDQ